MLCEHLTTDSEHKTVTLSNKRLHTAVCSNSRKQGQKSYFQLRHMHIFRAAQCVKPKTHNYSPI